MDAWERYKKNGWIVNIYQDETPESPREWSNLGTMACFHDRYNLGDKHNFSDPDELIQFIQDGNLIFLPLHLYDHSGITMNTSGFHDPWDSGQVGFIYVTREDIIKEYGWKVITKARREKIEQYLRGEVETYDQYLTGDVWGYEICHPNGDSIDSCWGFYGLKYCKEEANSCVPANPPEDAERYQEKLEDLEEV